MIPATGVHHRNSAARPIWFATSALAGGGPDRVISILALAAVRAGHPVTIVTGRASESNAELVRAAGARILETGKSRYPVAQLRRLLPTEEDATVIATQRMMLAGAIALTTTRSRARFVVRPANHPLADLQAASIIQSLKRQTATRVELLLSHRVAGVLCQSPQVADAVAQMGGRLAKAPRCIVPNPVDLNGHELSPSPPYAAPARGKPTLVSMGRLTRQKGYDILLHALRPAVDRHPELRLWLLGVGEDEQVLRRLVSELQLERNVSFLGQVDRPHALLRLADIYVMSSRYEGLSNALIEAQAAGLPAVATMGAASGDEVVTAGRTGWLCEPDSVTSLATALLDAVEQYGHFDPGEISRTTRARFNPDVVWTQYASFILSLPPRGGRWYQRS